VKLYDERGRRLRQADICQFDVTTWFHAVKFWAQHADPRGRKCLEVGAGAGGVSLWLAQAGGTVTCSDLWNTEERASPLHRKYGVSERITYVDIDAETIPFENEFDIVVFKSVLGALRTKDRQLRAVAGMHRALRPGGKLLFAENLTGTRIHGFFRRTFRSWSAQWRYVALGEITEFLSRFSTIDVRTTGVLAVFGANEPLRSVLSIVDRVALNRLCPAGCHYLVYGIATKSST
jgi:ubiquinone/menaquinone biosynthesis C-methylase UbiE